ncbi:MAG TPA: LuxR C-terminal-related transcriptional regulator [Gaiellaceae bacterium]
MTRGADSPRAELASSHANPLQLRTREIEGDFVFARDLEGPSLTRRQLEVLRLVAVGRTNREVARELFLSPRTIDMHVRNVLGKLDCRSRTEATSKANALGLLEPTSAAP